MYTYSQFNFSNPFKQFKPDSNGSNDSCCVLTLQVGNTFLCGNSVHGKIGIEKAFGDHNERILVNVQLTGWLKIKLTDTEEQVPSFFRNGFFLRRKSKTMEYKNKRELLRYTCVHNCILS